MLRMSNALSLVRMYCGRMVVIFKGNLNHAVDKPQAIMQVLHFNKNTLLPGYFTTIYIFLV